MFVQIINGQVVDRSRLREQLTRWANDLRPSAGGFLGSTAGIAEDGRFAAVVRFDNEPAARANSARAEQASWWNDTERCFDGAASFRESEDIELLGSGGSDEAGFVQIIEGRTTDRAKFMDLERQLESGFLDDRPDFIGSFLIWCGNGSWVEVAYFTSEEAARAGEARGFSPDVGALFAQWQQVAVPSSYLDLTEPLIIS